MPRQLKHRSRSEIIASILEVTNGNKVRRTEIQYKNVLIIQHTDRVFGASTSVRPTRIYRGRKDVQNYSERYAGITDAQQDGGIIR